MPPTRRCPGSRQVAFARLLRAEAKYAIAPRVGAVLESQLFASGTIDRNHLVDFRLHLSGPLCRGCAAAQQSCQRREYQHVSAHIRLLWQVITIATTERTIRLHGKELAQAMLRRIVGRPPRS